MDLKQQLVNVAFIIAIVVLVAWSVYSFLAHRRGKSGAAGRFVNGVVFIAICFVGAAILLPIYAGQRPVPNMELKVDAKALATALSLYNHDFGALPPTDDLEGVAPYLKEEQGTRVIRQQPPALVMNVYLSGKDLVALESKVNIPLVHSPAPLPEGTYLVVFTNSEMRFVAQEELYLLLKRSSHIN